MMQGVILVIQCVEVGSLLFNEILDDPKDSLSHQYDQKDSLLVCRQFKVSQSHHKHFIDRLRLRSFCCVLPVDAPPLLLQNNSHRNALDCDCSAVVAGGLCRFTIVRRA